MTSAERDWVDAYHARVATALGEIVDAQTRDWLAAATASLPVSR
jgi:Xaa-Pro aminopeptidase